MSYFDLLCTRKYFDIFLNHHNRGYAQTGQQREKHYSQLIKRYRSSTARFADLISDRTHINDVYQSLGTEFRMNMRAAKLVSFGEFWNSTQSHKEVLIKLSNHKMENLNPNAVPQTLLEDLERLFHGLKVVPPSQKRKLVAVSKTLHFLLPDLVMPVDNAGVLHILRKRGIPEDDRAQYRLFTWVFSKYIELAAKLGLKQSNGDGSWWNISVPKRIDNAIAGLWSIFNERNVECMICDHIDMLLTYLNKRPAAVSRTAKVKWEDIATFIRANPSGSADMMKQSGLSYADTGEYMKRAGLAPDEINRILSKVYSDREQ